MPLTGFEQADQSIEFRRFQGVKGNESIAQENEIIRIIDGSNLYGTSVDRSDVDQMGIFIEPPEYVLGFKKLDQSRFRTQQGDDPSQPGDIEGVIYSLRKYISLAIQGNPTILMLLFAPESKVLYTTEEGRQLQALAPHIVSKRAYPRFKGYLMSQRERLQKGGREEFVSKFGFDTKFAMHAVRLGYQGIELLKTGGLVLPIEGELVDFLIGIREGDYTLDQVHGELDVLLENLDKAHEESLLPEEPNFELVEDTIIKMHLNAWKG